MRKVYYTLGVWLAFFLVCTSPTLFAQGVTDAAINGVITTINGEILPGANIIAVHLPTGTQYGTTSRIDGNYNILGMKVGGPYEVTVSFVGYLSQKAENVYLTLSQNLKIDFSLPEGEIEIGTVTVTSERGSILSEGRTGASQNVSLTQIESIPTISRDFQNFAKLSPQISGFGGGSGGGDQGASALGRNNRYNNVQLDGSQYNDLFGLGASGTPGGQVNTTPISLDAVQEFQVVLAPYDVKFGGFTGAGINAITRSGTNQFHGSVFGFGRNESLVGKAGFLSDDPTTSTNEKDFAEFKEYQYGFRVGGPIMKDELFFFVSGEMTARDEPLTNSSLTQGPSNTRDLAQRMGNALRTRYNYQNVGSFDPFTATQPSTKIFGRIDWNISQNHHLTLRHNFVDADRDILGSRGASNQLSFSSFSYTIANQTNSSVVELKSTFGNNMSNEFRAGYTMIKDRRAGTDGIPFPQFELRETGITLYAGPDRFSSANELDQDAFEIEDNFSYLLGDHIFTVGTHNEFLSFRNLFVRSFFGYYRFNSIGDLENGLVANGGYERSFSRTNDPNQAADFTVNQYGFYLQDEWSVLPNFKLTAGVRVDIPTFPTPPAENDSVSKYFPGYHTSDIPDGNMLWSPRVGFNWDVSGDRSVQFRGGAGIFTGRIPYVWMSNNYGNTGTLYADISGGGANLVYSSDPYNQPKPGDPGVTSVSTTSEINIISPDFKFPQVLRFNVAMDHQLPFGITGTAEIVHSRSINDLVYEKLNLRDPVGKIKTTGSSTEDRILYNGNDSKNGNFTRVLLLKNTNEGYAWNFSYQLQRNVIRGLSVNAGYTYGISKDLNSVNSSQARSQMRYNPIDNDPNNPALTTSSYEVRDRIFVGLVYTHEFFNNSPTTISVWYNGQTGQPFSYIYGYDQNNDGFDNNDLLYVPRNPSEILLGSVSNGVFTPNQSQYDAFFSFIENNEGLRENKGKIVERNSAYNPFRHGLDLRIAQDVDLAGFGHFQVTLDILNVINLIDSQSGWNESLYSTYPTLRSAGTRLDGVPVYSFSAPENNTPYTADDLTSRWQMQLGVRYTF